MTFAYIPAGVYHADKIFADKHIEKLGGSSPTRAQVAAGILTALVECTQSSYTDTVGMSPYTEWWTDPILLTSAHSGTKLDLTNVLLKMDTKTGSGAGYYYPIIHGNSTLDEFELEGGKLFMPNNITETRLLMFYGSNNIWLRDVRIVSFGQTWGAWLINVSGGGILNMKFTGAQALKNNDGLHLTGIKNFVVDGVRGTSGDDLVAITHDTVTGPEPGGAWANQPTQNLIIRNVRGNSMDSRVLFILRKDNDLQPAIQHVYIDGIYGSCGTQGTGVNVRDDTPVAGGVTDINICNVGVDCDANSGASDGFYAYRAELFLDNIHMMNAARHNIHLEECTGLYSKLRGTGAGSDDVLIDSMTKINIHGVHSKNAGQYGYRLFDCDNVNLYGGHVDSPVSHAFRMELTTDSLLDGIADSNNPNKTVSEVNASDRNRIANSVDGGGTASTKVGASTYAVDSQGFAALKRSVTGSRGGNAALASHLTGQAAIGNIVDNSTA